VGFLSLSPYENEIFSSVSLRSPQLALTPVAEKIQIREFGIRVVGRVLVNVKDEKSAERLRKNEQELLLLTPTGAVTAVQIANRLWRRLKKK
jgi:hypothetical protein